MEDTYHPWQKLSCKTLLSGMLSSLMSLDQLDNECIKLCQVTMPSLFSKVPPSELESFEWERCICDLQEKTPLFLQILSTIASRNDHRNKCKAGKVHYPGICMAAAVILKERCQLENDRSTISDLFAAVFITC